MSDRKEDYKEEKQPLVPVNKVLIQDQYEEKYRRRLEAMIEALSMTLIGKISATKEELSTLLISQDGGTLPDWKTFLKRINNLFYALQPEDLTDEVRQTNVDQLWANFQQAESICAATEAGNLRIEDEVSISDNGSVVVAIAEPQKAVSADMKRTSTHRFSAYRTMLRSGRAETTLLPSSRRDNIGVRNFINHTVEAIGPKGLFEFRVNSHGIVVPVDLEYPVDFDVVEVANIGGIPPFKKNTLVVHGKTVAFVEFVDNTIKKRYTVLSGQLTDTLRSYFATAFITEAKELKVEIPVTKSAKKKAGKKIKKKIGRGKIPCKEQILDSLAQLHARRTVEKRSEATSLNLELTLKKAVERLIEAQKLEPAPEGHRLTINVLSLVNYWGEQGLARDELAEAIRKFQGKPLTVKIPQGRIRPAKQYTIYPKIIYSKHLPLNKRQAFWSFGNPWRSKSSREMLVHALNYLKRFKLTVTGEPDVSDISQLRDETHRVFENERKNVEDPRLRQTIDLARFYADTLYC